jgi:hypothetical protein
MSPSCLAGLIALTVSAPLPPKPAYQWKFEPGRTFYLEMTTDTRQEMSVLGQKIPQTQSQVFVFSLTPERQLPDGTWLLRQRIVGVRFSMDLGGTKLEYDSARADNAKNPLADFMANVVGADFGLQLERTKGVVAVEGRERFLARLGDASPEMKVLLQTILTDDALKEMCGQVFTALPDRPVYRGDSWQRRSRYDLGPVGLYESTHRYTYTGLRGSNESFKVEVMDVRYEPPARGASGLPFKVVNADLKGTGHDGEMMFDRGRGRVVQIASGLTLEGSLTIDIGGQETKLELKQDQKTTVRTLDANPFGK